MNGQGCSINKGASKIDQVFHQPSLSSYHRTMYTRCFTESMYSTKDTILQAEFYSKSCPITPYAGTVRFIYDQVCSFFFAQLYQRCQGSNIPIHRINRLYHHKYFTGG